MAPGNQSQKPFRDISIVLAALWAIRLAFILIMPEEARSVDTFSWQAVAHFLDEGLNPYHVSTFLNWPPFWMQLIFCISKTATFLGIPFFRALQIFLILIESIVIIQAFKLIQELAPAANARNILLFGIALNPVAILLTCQHCNFDVIVVLWILLFIRSLIQFSRTGDIGYWLHACLFLGLGILTKTIPLILIPLLARGFREAKKPLKWVGSFLVLAPVILGMSIIYVLSPADTGRNVLGYRSSGNGPSFYGIPGLFHLAGLDHFLFIQHFAFYGLIVICLVVTWNLSWHRRIDEKEMVLLPALILLGIPTLGPGWAPQYAYWFLPFLVISYALYNSQWKRLLVGVGLVNACTYIFEYAVLPGLGYSLWYFLNPAKTPGSDQALASSPAMQNFFRQVTTEGWLAAMGMPMFIADMVLLISGFRMLNLGSFLNVRPLKVFYSLVIGSVAVCILGILFFQGPAKAQAANEPEPDPLLQKSRFQNVIELNNLAWVLATSPDNQIRDGSLAVELARRACELTHYETPIPMSTLAAAYAEAGHFEDAVSTAQDACTLAGQLGETNVLNKNQQLLLLYQSHKPYRVTELPANSPSPSR
jgi:hypothetical protein